MNETHKRLEAMRRSKGHVLYVLLSGPEDPRDHVDHAVTVRRSNVSRPCVDAMGMSSISCYLAQKTLAITSTMRALATVM